MSSSSSDEELADLESFAPRKKRRLTPPAPEKVEVPKPTKSSTRLGEEKVKKKAKAQAKKTDGGEEDAAESVAADVDADTSMQD